ncbi:MAG: HlyC/CorC family transporter [bacterium]|nr:HlyC/CorC family transporter [bacterium]
MLIALLFGIILGFFSAYVVSLYALAVYIDPDEVGKLLPRMSRRRRSLILKVAGDPRAFLQVAAVYRSFALIAITASSLIVMTDLIPEAYLYKTCPIGLAAIWLLYVVLVEYLPRRSSRKAINRRMIRYLWLITAIYVVFFPVVRVYRNALQRIHHDDRVTEEEKEEIVERAIETLAEQAGIGEAIVEEDEKEMIGQIFLLDQTQVREIMAPRIDITAIDKATGYAAIAALVREHGYSRYPVYEGTIDKTVGILYVKDLFSNMPKPGEEFVIADYLRKPFFVPESKVIGDLLREFRGRKLHIAIVVDEYGGVAGLVTLEDILEEIVGEIRDEHDFEEDEIRRLSDGRYVVDASMRVEKLQDSLSIDYDQEEYDTVGGLIYDLVGSVPGRGDHVKWHDIDFEIIEVDGQRIKTVKVHKL